jgi:DNA-binding MarR family transcriptional regulator
MQQGGDLDALIGYQLKRANLTMTDDARAALAPYGVSLAKLTALLLVRANPGCDQTALGRALSINRSSAMKLVNFLVERGLIERRPGRDLRSNALHVAPGGEELLDKMLGALRASDERSTARLSAGERAMLTELLHKLGGE